MQISIDPAELEFAREVDRLGEDGKSQDEIAAHFGLSRAQVRHRLDRSHLAWAAESRVRLDVNNVRLEDAVRQGVLVPAATTPQTERETTAREVDVPWTTPASEPAPTKA